MVDIVIPFAGAGLCLSYGTCEPMYYDATPRYAQLQSTDAMRR